MDSPENNDRYHALETENRHLQEMIGALRDEMEKMRIGEQERLQKSLSSAHEEIGQLRNMIVALREELDRKQAEAEEKCRIIEQTARDEAKQLQEMIRALRGRLEDHERHS